MSHKGRNPYTCNPRPTMQWWRYSYPLTAWRTIICFWESWRFYNACFYLGWHCEIQCSGFQFIEVVAKCIWKFAKVRKFFHIAIFRWKFTMYVFLLWWLSFLLRSRKILGGFLVKLVLANLMRKFWFIFTVPPIS